MTRIVRNRQCPTCGGIDLTRKHRSFWMRWFSGSRFYQCRHCRTGILVLYDNKDARDEGLADG